MTAGAGYKYLYDDEGNRTTKFVDQNSDGLLDAGDTDVTTYSWDNRNRLTDVVHRAAFGDNADWSEHNSYDYLNRLIHQDVRKVQNNVTTETQTAYVYDANGNRISSEDHTWEVGSDNQMTYSDNTGPGYNYLYDNEGNRTVRFIDNNGNGQLDDGDSVVSI